MDFIGFMSNNDDAYAAKKKREAEASDQPPPLPTPAQLLRINFDRASQKGSGVLLALSFGTYDLFGPMLAFDSLTIQDDADLEKTRAVFCATGASINGLYDLQKSFDTAKGGLELLPAAADKVIREALYERIRPHFSVWQKLKFRNEDRRAAFLQTFEFYDPR
ncbi:MAG: hypothetical protein JWO78_594 [Micavibrio sp.]|nr:hypothetical protein [Micavibrio sp.]